jgi:predicted transglutaminase-like cysteine proteinase
MKTKTLIVIFTIIIIVLSSIIIFDIIPDNEVKIIDSDNDKISDKIDAFPNDPSASLDSDGDGYPDFWNPGKSQEDSTSNPKLIRDECPYDPDEHKDSDGDFVGDNKDVFPNDPSEWSDIDSDGYGDNKDINPYVNLSFEIKIKKFKVSRRVDLFRWAQVYFDIRINNKKYLKIDNNGKYFQVGLNQIKDVTHQIIIYDIPDDTINTYTDIEIIMMDYDFIGSDDVIDISNNLGEKTLKLKFDHIRNEISLVGPKEGKFGKIWYDIIYEKEIDLNEIYYKLNFTWTFNNKRWNLTSKIPVNTYKNYQTLNVSRQPQSQPFPDENMANFVTSEERVILDIVDNLESLIESENYNDLEKVNFYLSFIQKVIRYRYDNETAGCEEYWKYPVETLVEQLGDCEDTSVLLASILDNLGYDVSLLYYSWKEAGQRFGHLALGVNLQGNLGSFVFGSDGKKYFYCETTSEGFKVGEIPSKIKGEPKRIILI